MSEEFAFEKRLADGCTVHRQEWQLAAFAVGVDGAGDQFLARAAFSLDQHRDILGGDTADRFVELVHG